MLKYLINTYGCQMNYSDSERMATYLEALGYQKALSVEGADLIVFNSCSVRQKAEDRVLGHMGTLHDLKKKNPKLIVVLTGCMVRTSSSRHSKKPDKVFHSASEMDIALRIEELPKFAALLKEVNPKIHIKEIPEQSFEDYFKIKPNYTSKAQAFLPVSTGCDKFCTYCIVPFSRGREKSRPIKEILKEAADLVKNGCKEITLIGQTVNSYGLSNHDRKYYNPKTNNLLDVPKGKLPFVYLLEQIDKLYSKGLRRLRFTSPHPRDMSPELIAAMAKLKTLMPYLHLPIQSGDNAVLKRMNRTYTCEEYLKTISALRKAIPGISISTDVIVGFCGETKEEFKNTLKLFKKVQFDLAYLAQYSVRSGTFSAKNMKDDVPAKEKKVRWNALNDLLRKTSYKNHQRFDGKTLQTLIECKQGNKLIGRTEHYKMVEIKIPKKIPLEKIIGEILPVKITKAREWLLKGEIIMPTTAR